MDKKESLFIFEYQGMNVWYDPIINQVLLEYQLNKYRKPDVDERRNLCKFGLEQIVLKWLMEYKPKP